MDEKCIQVTEHDEFIAEVDKLAVHRHQARRHRAISVWGFTSKHEVLLQQRSAVEMCGQAKVTRLVRYGAFGESLA